MKSHLKVKQMSVRYYPLFNVAMYSGVVTILYITNIKGMVRLINGPVVDDFQKHFCEIYSDWQKIWGGIVTDLCCLKRRIYVTVPVSDESGVHDKGLQKKHDRKPSMQDIRNAALFYVLLSRNQPLPYKTEFTAENRFAV
ncbi:hypothetical protein ACT7CZ_31830 [Bacillus cereus]